MNELDIRNLRLTYFAYSFTVLCGSILACRKVRIFLGLRVPQTCGG